MPAAPMEEQPPGTGLRSTRNAHDSSRRREGRGAPRNNIPGNAARSCLSPGPDFRETGAMDSHARHLIDQLQLSPHPEGGWYRQTWMAAETDAGGRPVGTAILFLLAAGERSHWHHVDATEIWHFHAGAPLLLSIAETAQGPARHLRLGPDIAAGDLAQGIVPTGHWQAARSTGSHTLVGCTVSPGFRFDGFELAPPGFDIP